VQRESLEITTTEDPASGSQSFLTRAAIIIPTYNAAGHWSALYAGLQAQGVCSEQVMVIDSSSTDNTRELVRAAGYRLQRISAGSFNHGATRQLAAENFEHAEFLVYLTQDAVLASPDSIRTLLSAFVDPLVGAAYGRQLPRNESGPLEYHARLFNYPARAEVRDFASRERLGFRAAFFSNSFAAYRNSAFREVGGFSQNTIVSEEVSVVVQMLMCGWKIAYQANAEVFHSHSFSLRQEFSRYFDIGVHHARERQLMEQFGRVEGEGVAFVKSELKFLWRTRPAYIPLALVRNFNKWVGYQMGKNEQALPNFVKKSFSSQANFWNAQLGSTAIYRLQTKRYHFGGARNLVSENEQHHERGTNIAG